MELSKEEAALVLTLADLAVTGSIGPGPARALIARIFGTWPDLRDRYPVLITAGG